MVKSKNAGSVLTIFTEKLGQPRDLFVLFTSKLEWLATRQEKFLNKIYANMLARRKFLYMLAPRQELLIFICFKSLVVVT